MQVPAYDPVPCGVQLLEYSGVVTLWKNTMAMSAMVIVMEDMSISMSLVEDGMELVLVIDMLSIAVEVAMVMLLSMLSIGDDFVTGLVLMMIEE